MSKKLKIAGLIVFMFVFVLTMTACDNAMRTGSDVTEEVEETGDLLVTADLSEIESEDKSNEVGVQSVVENRFENYKVEITVEHQGSNRIKSETTDSSNDFPNSPNFKFDALLAGNWNVTIKLIADYKYDDVTEIITDVEVATEEFTVTITAGETTKVDSVTVGQNDGHLKIDFDLADGVEKITQLELRDINNNDNMIKSESEITNKSTVVDWEDIFPKQYELFIEIKDSEGNLHSITESLMIIPGITKEITIKFYEGKLDVIVDWDMPPARPTNLLLDGDTLTWDDIWEVDEVDSFNIVREEYDSGKTEIIEKGIEISSNNTGYSYTDENAVSGLPYVYRVVAVKEHLTSEYSEYSNPGGLKVAYVTNEDEKDNALINTNISTIILDGTFDAFKVARDNIIITGGTVTPSNNINGVGGVVGIYLQGVTGVVIDGVTIQGANSVNNDRGIMGAEQTEEYTVVDSTFNDLATGIYANSGQYINTELTATGNTFTGGTAGIGGTENTLLNAIENNKFKDLAEGIGLGNGVSSSLVDYLDIKGYLEDNNNFEVCTDNVKDHRSDIAYVSNGESIQTAINVASEGDAIIVGAGNYDENLLIDKPISLLGPNAKISAVTGNRVDEAFLLQKIDISAHNDVTISGFEFLNVETASTWTIYIQGVSNNFTFNNNRFIDIKRDAIHSGMTSSTGNITVIGNLIDGLSDPVCSGIVLGGIYGKSIISDNKIDLNSTGYAGIQTPSADGLTISGNEIYNTTNQGLQLAGACGDVTIENNIIDNANTSQGTDKGAIRLYGTEFTGIVTITGNTLTNSYNGIAVKDGMDIEGKDISVNNNNLSGNSNNGAYNGASTGTLDATKNWWGTSDETVIEADKIEGAVDYKPYYTDENMTTLSN